MNWLAHIFLSEQNIDFQIGNYLADPLKGRVWENSSNDLKRGMLTHKRIDSFTDSNEFVKQSKKRLREKGLLKSIVIDITYDYFLYKNWSKFCNEDFESFTQNFYKEASKTLKTVPEIAFVPLNRIIKFRVLNNYKSVDELKTAFERLDKRLSKKLLSRDSASSYFDAVKENIDALEEDFLHFFPLLCKEVKENVDTKKLKHWQEEILF